MTAFRPDPKNIRPKKPKYNLRAQAKKKAKMNQDVDSGKIMQHSEGKRAIKRKKATGEYALFEMIWNTRPHHSELSGIPISYPHPSNFVHVLAKGQGKYPLFKLFEQNIVILTEFEHHLYDNGTEGQRNTYAKECAEMGHECDWNRLGKLALFLKNQYQTLEKVCHDQQQ